MKSLFVSALMAVCLAILPGCNESTVVGAHSNDDPDAMMSGDVEGLNYTPYYVDRFIITGHDNGIEGGGPNIDPARPDHIPAQSGGACCGTFPVHWRPGLKVTVRWIANKKLDGVPGIRRMPRLRSMACAQGGCLSFSCQGTASRSWYETAMRTAITALLFGRLTMIPTLPLVRWTMRRIVRKRKDTSGISAA